jgi:fatty acid-binding protein DegV
VPIVKVKGRTASIEKMVEMLAPSVIDPAEQTADIGHADCLEEAEALKEKVMKLGFADAYINVINPVVGACIGPGTIGVWALGKKVETAI